MRKDIVIIIILILLAGNIALGVNYYLLRLELGRTMNASQTNGRITVFNSLFINKVLRTQGAVSTEDRLRLENAVFGTGDPQVVKQWQVFLASTTEQQAQSGALQLLNMLSNKIIY